MKLDHLAERHFSNFPEDVRAILSLFPDEYELKSDTDGRYFDIMKGDNGTYTFYQIIGRTREQIEANRKRFFRWVREGMPEGYTGDEGKFWEVEE